MTNVINKVIKNGTEYEIYAGWWASGAWDVFWPSSSTDADIALFDWTTWKIIKDSWKKLSNLQTTANLKTSLSDNSDSYYPSQKAVKTAVDWKQSQHSSISVTLSSSSWSSKSQTVTATWVTASNTVIVSPAPASFSDYSENGVYCYSQASDSLTFKCEDTPSSNITVNVVILN